MKKSFLFIIISSFLLLPVLADDGWDDFSGIDHAWDGQKSITNKEFEEAIDTLEGNQKKKEAKKRKKLIKKIGGGGTSLHSELSPDSDILDMDPLKKEEDNGGSLLNVPVNLVVDGGVLDKGFYKVIAQKEEDGIYLLFYQSQYFKGKVKATRTEDDFDEEYIDFVKLIPLNNNTVRIIYGSLDYNAYAVVKFVSQ